MYACKGEIKYSKNNKIEEKNWPHLQAGSDLKLILFYPSKNLIATLIRLIAKPPLF